MHLTRGAYQDTQSYCLGPVCRVGVVSLLRFSSELDRRLDVVNEKRKRQKRLGNKNLREFHFHVLLSCHDQPEVSIESMSELEENRVRMIISEMTGSEGK